MFRERYHALYETVLPDEKLIAQLSLVPKQRKRLSHISWKRTLVLAVLLVVALAVPVFGGTLQSIFELMHLVPPSVAEEFTPVQKSDIYDGIQLEVVAVHVYDTSTELYITLQDTTGDRIGEGVDFYDSYSIHTGFNSESGCALIDFDQASGVATFLITICEDKARMENTQITFTATQILSSLKKYENQSFVLSADQVDVETAGKVVDFYGADGAQLETYLGDLMGIDAWEATVLQADMEQPLLEDAFTLTGVGFLDGNLHIQVAKQSATHYEFVYLKTGDVQIDYAYSIGFREKGIEYSEYVFDLPNDGTAYTLCGDFYVGGELLQGDWRVTVPVVTE